MAVNPTPKIRSRKLGAAIVLDEFDKRLLNRMQGAFPIARRPYADVATALVRAPRPRRRPSVGVFR